MLDSTRWCIESVTLDVTDQAYDDGEWSSAIGADEPGQLEAATSVGDLAALPGNRFEALSGNRKGQYSIRINDQWRICFEWPDGSTGPVNVEIVDYH